MPRGCLAIFLSLSHVILKAGIISPFIDEKNRLRLLSPGHPSLLCTQTSLLLRSRRHLVCQRLSDLCLWPCPLSWQIRWTYLCPHLIWSLSRVCQGWPSPPPWCPWHHALLCFLPLCLVLCGPFLVWELAFPALRCLSLTQQPSLTGWPCLASWLWRPSTCWWRARFEL